MKLFAAAVIITLASVCFGETLTVSHDANSMFNVIQDAVDYSYDGDTIIIKPGTYNEDIYFNGRAITLTSQDPNNAVTVAVTVINGTVTFDMEETESSIIEGLAIGSPSPTIKKLGQESNFQYCNPKIYGDTVIWDRSSYNQGTQIIAYNRNTGQSTTIGSADQMSKGIYEDIVVYSHSNNILGVNYVTGQDYIICLGQQNNRGEPAIYGNIVVWWDSRSNYSYYGGTIYGYDLSKHQEFQIGTQTSGQGEPAIHGDIVVWSDTRNGNHDIYGYKLSTKQEFAVCVKPGDQIRPVVWGDMVVWVDYRNGRADMYSYNLTNQQEILISGDGDTADPAIYGNTVVWANLTNNHIHRYDLMSKVEGAITLAGRQSKPAIYGDAIVWQDEGDWGIYETTSQIPVYANSGVVCYATSPTIRKNTIQNCTRSGIYGAENSSPTVSMNTILSCLDYGIYNCGGAITSNNISSCLAGISSCNGTISNNILQANQTGIDGCSGTIEKNTIAKNKTGSYNCSGLIVHNVISANTDTGISWMYGTIQNNVISGNERGIAECSGTIVNNTFTGNKTAVSSGWGTFKNNILAFNDMGISGQCGNSYNCFWKNTAGNFVNGAYGKTGDFSADPRFATPGHWDDKGTPSTADDEWVDGDYHLKSEVGRWSEANVGWVQDTVTSACIDKGDPSDLIGSEPNPNGGRINLGMYGGTGQASKSKTGSGPNPIVTCSQAIPGDANNDCKINMVDFAIMAAHWLECNLEPIDACWN